MTTQLPDGTCIRDYIHVVDLAKAHVVAIKRLLEKRILKIQRVFNIGTGKGASVLEVIKAFEEVSGIKLNYVFKDRSLVMLSPLLQTQRKQTIF